MADTFPDLPYYFVFCAVVMRGGWRFGAGRPAHHGKVEHYRRLDIRRWAREGMLTGGGYFGWQWQEDGKQVASIGVRVNAPDLVTLIYRWQRDGVWRDEFVPIRLAKTVCYYGGERPWFICPHCGHQAAILYLASGKWFCRKSLKLAYASQSEDHLDRLRRKKSKLELKLKGSVKPKGMHQTTYSRLKERWINAEMAWDDEFTRRAVSMFGLLS